MAERPGGRKPGPRGTAAEKHRRDLAIFRAWLRGRSAAELAREHGLSERQVREVVRGMRGEAGPGRDASPGETADRVLAAMEEALGDLARAAYGLPSTARVGALRAYLRALDGYFRVLQKAGRVPKPDRMLVERDIERAVEIIIGVFERHGVPVEAQREIRDLVDGGGRALEAG